MAVPWDLFCALQILFLVGKGFQFLLSVRPGVGPPLWSLLVGHWLVYKPSALSQLSETGQLSLASGNPADGPADLRNLGFDLSREVG